MTIKLQTFGFCFITILILFISTAAAIDTPRDIQESTSIDIKKETEPVKNLIVGNKDTMRYHLPGMPYYNKVRKHHRIYFDSEQQAIDNGYYKAGTGKDSARIVSPAGERTIKKESIQASVYAPVKTPSPGAKASHIFFNYKIVIAFIIFILLFFIPFLPAVLEIIRKQDSYPLFIPMDYNKDPRYFCKSFKNILQNAVDGLPREPRIREVMLSRKENLQITDSLSIPAGAEVENLLYVQGDVSSDVNVHFKKDVYVLGNAFIGTGNVLHVLAAEGNMTIADGATFERWLDAQGDLEIGSNCHLGISASCGGKLHIAEECSFRRLYGMPVTTGKIQNNPETDSPKSLPPKETAKQVPSFTRITESSLKEGSVLDGNFVFLNDVRIGRNSVINGSIKGYGDIEMEDHVTVYGNIFADGKIFIGKSAIIGGHVFSQNSIHVSENSVISKSGVIKSVLGKKLIRLASNVTIYGYVSTEGKGRII